MSTVQVHDQLDIEMLGQVKMTISDFDPNSKIDIQHKTIKERIDCLAIGDLQLQAINYWLDKSDWTNLSEELKTKRVEVIIETIALVKDRDTRIKLMDLVRSKPYKDFFPIKRDLELKINELRGDQKKEKLVGLAQNDIRGANAIINPGDLDPLFPQQPNVWAITSNRHPGHYSSQPLAAYANSFLAERIADEFFAKIEKDCAVFNYMDQNVILDQQNLSFRPLDQNSVRLITSRFWFYRWLMKNDDLILRAEPGPTRDLLLELCQNPYFLAKIPNLARIFSEFCIVKKQDKIQFITEKGYDAETKIRLTKDSVIDQDRLQSPITKEDAKKAWQDIEQDAFKDVAFATDMDRIHAMAATLSFKVLPMLSRTAWLPNFAINAPEGGQGKSTLTSIITSLGTGQLKGQATIPLLRESNWDRKEYVDSYQLQTNLGPELLNQPTSIVFDNVEGLVKSDYIERMTTEEVGIRMIGTGIIIRYGSVHCPKLPTFFNGNNLKFGGALPRRSLLMNLQKFEGFSEDSRWEPKNYIVEPEVQVRHQTNLAIILQYWIGNGMPQKQAPKVFNGSKGWYGIIGGICELIIGEDNMKQFAVVNDDQNIDQKEWSINLVFSDILKLKGAIALHDGANGHIKDDEITEELLKGKYFRSVDDEIINIALRPNLSGKEDKDEPDKSKPEGFLDEFTDATSKANRRAFWKNIMDSKKSRKVCEYDDKNVILFCVQYDAEKASWVPKREKRVWYLGVVGKEPIEPEVGQNQAENNTSTEDDVPF